MKSIERAHMPKKLWERVKLPVNYEKALEIIDKHLMYWPKFLVHKIKQRLTKMTQMRIRMRKLALKTREKIMTTPRKEIKRESRREKKALGPAALDKSIEKELIERLKKGVYGDICNVPFKYYNKTFDANAEMEIEEEGEEEEDYEDVVEYVADDGYEEEEEDIEYMGGLAVHHSHADDDNFASDEELEVVIGKRGKKYRKNEKDGAVSKSKKPGVHVEVEYDEGRDRQKTVN